MLAKICGVTTLTDAHVASEAHADFIGLIFHKKSKRYVDEETAKEIIRSIEDTPIVGVFFDEPIQVIAKVAKRLNLEWVQLPAPKDPADLSPLANLKKILVLAVNVEGYYQMAGYKNPGGYWLYDGCAPGSGQQFDWNLFAPKEEGPFFIAGGLDANNAKEVIERFRPDGLDVATGVTRSDGILKDPRKVEEFVKVVHDEQ